MQLCFKEDEALRLLEARKETKRFVELREMVKDMDYDKNRELSFLEWCCAYFSKSWKDLHRPSADQSEVEAKLTQLRNAQQKEIETARFDLLEKINLKFQDMLNWWWKKKKRQGRPTE